MRSPTPTPSRDPLLSFATTALRGVTYCFHGIGIERHFMNYAVLDPLNLSNAAPIARQADFSALRRRRRYRLGWAERFAGAFVDRHPPKVHTASAIAREIEESAVGCPGRTPRFNLGSRARKTSTIPPPTRSITSYGPIRVPGVTPIRADAGVSRKLPTRPVTRKHSLDFAA